MSLDGKLFAALARLWKNWPLWGGMLAMLLLARHFWLLFAPADRALPGNTAVRPTTEIGQLFGATDTSNKTTIALDGIRPVGIFAHPTRGFAVMQTPSGQHGVGLGSEVAPGIRLVETQADHVVLERNGIRQRIDLAAATNASQGSMTVPASSSQPVQPSNGTTTYDAVLLQLPPEQRVQIEQSQQDSLRGRP